MYWTITLAMQQTMTEAEHNRPNPKLFSNRPSASAAEVFGLLIGHWKFPKKIHVFSVILSLKEARFRSANLFFFKEHLQILF